MKVNVLGSCISRISLLDGDSSGHGIAHDEIELKYFLDKQNIALSVMPPPFSENEVLEISAEGLWDKSRINSLHQCLNKSTVKMLLESDADWLVMDLFDMQNNFAIFKETAFATCAHEYLRTASFDKYKNDIQIANFMNLPKWIWYPYVDIFFEKIMKKYDSNHIILNRFRSNTYYLDKDGRIKEIPDDFKNPFQANDKYNQPLKELEDYIIEKYNPYVIDLSQYFMGDATYWDNLNGAHFEKEFYRETFTQLVKIIQGKTDNRYYSEPDFFNITRRGYEEDRQRIFDVENGIETLEMLISKEDFLWVNVLDKLDTYAPNENRVKQYKTFMNDYFVEDEV